jgi:hypothetical protein
MPVVAVTAWIIVVVGPVVSTVPVAVIPVRLLNTGVLTDSDPKIGTASSRRPDRRSLSRHT